MKKLGIVFLVVAFLVVAVNLAFSAEAGNGFYEWKRLYSAAVGTIGSAVDGDAIRFTHPVTTISCDAYTNTTATFGVRIFGTQGYATTYDTTNTGPMVSAVTCTHCSFTITGKGLKTVKAQITTAITPTSVVRVECTGFR